MTRSKTDRELLESTWQLYTDEFADQVSEVVNPEDHVNSERQIDWGAQVFMFGYALGSIAGAHVAAPDSFNHETNSERVSNIVDTVIMIGEEDGINVSSTTIKDDFLNERS